MTSVVVLGATGSIGRQTLDVIAQHPTRLQVVGMAAGSDGPRLLEIGRTWPQAKLALFNPHPAFSGPTGMDALVELATLPEADLVVVSVAGVIGLLPTIKAIEAGKNIALASKEVLVAAGEIVMPLVAKHSVRLTPIDSEHSAIFQCLQGYQTDQIDRLILTASGGPFRGRSRAELAAVTRHEALNHPTWNMGGKITIDSATLMNKALETIEAKWLFGVEMDQVEIVVHPQSVIHSMVKFRDGSVLGQLGWPDMRLPIQYALLYPERIENDLRPWNPADTPSLTFEALDSDVFRGPGLAREAVRIGGTMPAFFNAANEQAVAEFLADRLGFLAITETVEAAMAQHQASPASLDNLLAADAEARSYVKEQVSSPSGAS
ncbi:MAG TPA: 1-deoxy-D-xylulose-5-phosphate reductoisomerase [Fimbriimonadaceae bacterium]|nr:1-deoxy-D-xylulose-5-phosphate reductoisomerase [Fimbriimonadaceae bacterium]